MAKHSMSEFADRVSDLMQVISKDFLRRQSADFYKTKITLPQFIVLDLLNRAGSTRMGDLARTVNVTTAAMTGITDRLVKAGYIVRASDPKDRRIVRVRLTAKGTALVEKAIEQRKKITADIFGVISEAEREEYLKILTHIRDHIMEKNH